MKTTVSLWGLNIEVTFESEEVTPRTIGEDLYDETVITDDGRLIGFDESVSAWVQLGIAE